MKKMLLALFLLAAIAGKGQTTDTIRIGPYGFLRSKYPEALYDFDPVWDRIVLMERRLDSLIAKSEDERVRLFNIKMEKFINNRLEHRLDSLQHRLDSLEGSKPRQPTAWRSDVHWNKPGEIHDSTSYQDSLRKTLADSLQKHAWMQMKLNKKGDKE